MPSFVTALYRYITLFTNVGMLDQFLLNVPFRHRLKIPEKLCFFMFSRDIKRKLWEKISQKEVNIYNTFDEAQNIVELLLKI